MLLERFWKIALQYGISTRSVSLPTTRIYSKLALPEETKAKLGKYLKTITKRKIRLE